MELMRGPAMMSSSASGSQGDDGPSPTEQPAGPRYLAAPLTRSLQTDRAIATHDHHALSPRQTMAAVACRRLGWMHQE